MEFWDIYDKDKKPTGRTMKKNDWILKDGEYHLSVLGVIHRPDGRFLITQRVMTKAWAPGWWEVSGGAAQAGESSFTAVCREVKEEVGLDVSQCPGGLAYTYHRENPGEGDNYFVDVYRFELDFKESDVQIQTEEALGFKIATLDEIKELAAQGVFLHYDSIKQVFNYACKIRVRHRWCCFRSWKRNYRSISWTSFKSSWLQSDNAEVRSIYQY